MTDINPNAVAAEVSVELIKASFNSILSGVSGSMKSAWSKIFADFHPYMEQVHRKNSQIRILCVKERDIEFKSIYVSSLFKCGNETLTDEGLVYKIRERNNVVINGKGIIPLTQV